MRMHIHTCARTHTHAHGTRDWMHGRQNLHICICLDGCICIDVLETCTQVSVLPNILPDICACTYIYVHAHAHILMARQRGCIGGSVYECIRIDVLKTNTTSICRKQILLNTYRCLRNICYVNLLPNVLPNICARTLTNACCTVGHG